MEMASPRPEDPVPPATVDHTFARIADDLETWQETFEYLTAEHAQATDAEYRRTLDQQIGEVKVKIEQASLELIGKTDALAAVLRRFPADLVEIKVEQERLNQRRRIIENAARRLREYVFGVMRQHNWSWLKTTFNTISIRRSGGRLALDVYNHAAVPLAYKTTTVRIAADQYQQFRDDLRRLVQVIEEETVTEDSKVRSALESGTDVPGARLLPRGENLCVR